MTAGEPLAELVCDTGDLVGESPRWDARRQRLCWIDMERPVAHTWHPAEGRLTSHDLPAPASCLELRRRGGFLAVVDGRLREFDEEFRAGDVLVDLPPLAGDAHHNDSGVDADGLLLLGSGSETVDGFGVVRRFDGIRLTSAREGLFLPNGIAADGRGVLVVDSFRRELRRLDGDDPVLRTEPARGWPDGLSVAADGAAWVAFWGGGAVIRLVPGANVESGAAPVVVRLPVPQVTSCAFGGPDLAELYVTTAAAGAPASPGAGGLFRVGAGALRSLVAAVPGAAARGREPVPCRL